MHESHHESAGKPSFGEIYQQQYREVSKSPASRISRWATPIIIGAAALAGAAWHRSWIDGACFAGVAITAFAVTIALAHRERRTRAAQPADPGDLLVDDVPAEQEDQHHHGRRGH